MHPSTSITKITQTTKWLNKLKLAELHRLAVLLGTPCSGTKTLRIDAIRGVLGSAVNGANGKDVVAVRDKLRVVSIDMGIRNLAFACLTGDSVPSSSTTSGIGGGSGIREFGSVKLTAWKKIDVAGSSSTSLSGGTGTMGLGSEDGKVTLDEEEAIIDDVGTPKKAKKANSKQKDNDSLDEEQPVATTNAFEPSVYAYHAYRIITSIVTDYNPTHILIERQRFRSGGSSAVLEWTIRVGVFEGMLYAVLRTLAGESKTVNQQVGSSVVVEGMLPARVNRFWLDGHNDGVGSMEGQTEGEITEEKRKKPIRMKGRDVKKAKIAIVGKLLETYRRGQQTPTTTLSNSSPQLSTTSPLPQLELDKEVHNLADYFTTEVNRPTNARRRSNPSSTAGGETNLSDTKINKLDDLADCLLQGLAWVQWRNNRVKVGTGGEDAFDVTKGEIV